MESRSRVRQFDISDRIVLGPLIDYSEAHYDSDDFSYYFNSTMDAFNAFYEKYNLVLLEANGRYQNFPDGSTQTLDFYNMEHAIGLSSFGQTDSISIDFMSDMLDCVTLRRVDSEIINEFRKDVTGIDAIIDFWETNKLLNSVDYAYINEMLKKYKNVDYALVQKKMYKLSRIILAKAYSNKGNLITYNPTINKRNEEITNDLVCFIDHIDNPRIKNLLFKLNDFTSKDDFDDKSLVIGYFTNYISNKYDINESIKGLGIDIGELINIAKNKYYGFYTDQVILDTMDKKPNNIKKKINDYINDTDNEYFNEIINKYINQDSVVGVINKNNIGFYIDQLNDDNLDVENMIFINNTIKNIDEFIDKNDKEIEKVENDVLEIQEMCDELLKLYREKFYSNLTDEDFNNMFKTLVRNKQINDTDSLENKIIELYRRSRNINSKLESLIRYGKQLDVIKDISNGYSDKIKNKIVNSLKDYTSSNLDIKSNKFMSDFICDLLHKNYYDGVVREIKGRNDNSVNITTSYLNGIIDSGRTDDIKLVIHNDSREMSSIFEGLEGYNSSDNDYMNALKLVSEVSDRFAVDYVMYLRDVRGKSTDEIIRHMRGHYEDVGLINLVHGLMGNTGVESFLKGRFDSKSGISINYDKLMYKCFSMSSIDELVTSRVKVAETVSNVIFKGISVSPLEEADIRREVNSINCPYIMFLGGNGDIKTLVYLTKRMEYGREKYVPLHSIRYEVGEGMSAMFTRNQILDGKYMPQRGNDGVTSGVEIKAGETSVISKLR